MEGEQPEVFEYMNSYLMDSKKLKPRTFNLFHRCQTRCYRNAKADETTMFNCVEQCRQRKPA